MSKVIAAIKHIVAFIRYQTGGKDSDDCVAARITHNGDEREWNRTGMKT